MVYPNTLTDHDRAFFVRLMQRALDSRNGDTVIDAIEKITLNMIERNVKDDARADKLEQS